MSTGREFVGPYRMYHLIRAGALFEIWAVRPVADNTQFAMKWLPPGDRHAKSAAAELKHEFHVGKQLEHKAIIETHDFGTSRKDGTWLIMELFKTPNLKQQIQAGIENLHWRLEEVLDLAADALDSMHDSGWVHRDIKPDNYLVSDDNDVRLIDFNLAMKIPKGLGKLFSSKTPVQGTYSYMAPEQIRGKLCDERTDVYSFGVMVYEMMSGKMPFTATSPAELLQKHLGTKPPDLTMLQKNIQPEFAQLVHRMLAKDPGDRPENLKQFRRELKAGRCFHIKPKKPDPEAADKDNLNQE
ncbi:serine/threonine protein kinase [Adhaeretor mobilis]|uniref:Serine/threonine-protein kinase pkn5 n=1 Tax=Adhaeretor mobilis TaxID=1930276 RepID=A0A517N0J4_9BACT|nr:serine/threonine-protein kinase [Adhaeretor mobilis]QDT00548.1 Serine/threonine-protein kinase pkn5 [Adhaeretor mobilis]